VIRFWILRSWEVVSGWWKLLVGQALRVSYTETCSHALLRAHGYPHSDAGFDMFSPIDTIIQPGETVSIDTGVILDLPKDTPRWWLGRRWHWEAQIRPRSSMRKRGVIASLGTIDAGFRGEIGCILHNHSREPYTIHRLDKICQIVFNRLPLIELIKVERVGETSRGSGRYGSTGR